MMEFRDVTRESFLACALLKSEVHLGYRLFESQVTSYAFSFAQAKGLLQACTCLSPCSPAS